MRPGQGVWLGKEQLGELHVQRCPEKSLVPFHLLTLGFQLTPLWEWPESIHTFTNSMN